MNKFDYKQMALIAETTPKNFLKMSKRYEDKLKKQGWQFTKEGKGKKAIYYVKDEIKKKPWEELTFKERFKELYDIKLKYPEVMEKYIKALHKNTNNIRILSDEKASIVIGCTRQRLNYCRKKLELASLIIPLKKQVNAKYYIYGNQDNDYEVEEISRDEYSEYWKGYFHILKHEIADNGYYANNKIVCEEKILKTIKNQAMKELQTETEGYLVKIKIKQPTDKFFNDYSKLFS